MQTVYEMYIQCKNQLNNELEAREICAFALDLDRRRLFDHSNSPISLEKIQYINDLIEKRLEGKPLAYILGEWEFYSLTFKVDENVLIPRADTETLVDVALDFLKEQSHIILNKKRMKILDLCAGSGCVGIAIGKNYQNSTIFACDISKNAIKIAEDNAKTNEIINYTIYEDSVLEPKMKYPMMDLIVSNPPYIKKNDIQTLDKDVKNYEPHLALDGGEDGLIFYEKICENYIEFLNYGGKIIFEYGINQEEDIKCILEKYKFENIKITKDLCGVNRIIEATKYKLD